MLNKDIWKQAKTLDTEDVGRMRKTGLIRKIQMEAGNLPCFNEPLCSPCRSNHCDWKEDCASHPVS